MPHRVADFLRASTSSLENQVALLAKKKTATSATRGRDPTSRSTSGSRGSESLFPPAFWIDSDADDAHAPALMHAPRRSMGESRSSSFGSDSHKDHGHHRLSFPVMHFGRHSKESHAGGSVALDWKLESPPIIMYGDAENSTGALVSGQLFLDIRDENVEIESFNATLKIHVTQKRPFANHCHDCANQCIELKKWCLLPHPLLLSRGQHSFPFSVLLEGHLPATMEGLLTSIGYEFIAETIHKSAGVPQPPIRLQKSLDVKRSLPASELPHHSVRVFPPTNIKASAWYPHVIHPVGSYTLRMRLDGISRHNAKAGTIEYWKLNKLTWRLEESAKAIAPACDRHRPPIKEGEEQQKKGIARAEERVIGEKTIFSGWKSDYSSTTDSFVELELEYNLAKHAKYTCDTKCRDGTEVTHHLMVEMVVAQEWAPVDKPSLVTHTGVGRILRIHFGTILTERGGIGISWDNEAPPIYQDVPPSPPAYSQEMALERESSIAEVIEPLDGDDGHRQPGPER